jgi:hypothetical protein
MHPVVRYCFLAVGAAIALFGAALVLDTVNSGASAPFLNRVGGAAAFGFVIALGLKRGGTLAGPPLMAGVAAALAVLFVPNLVSIPAAYILGTAAPGVLEAVVTNAALTLVWGLLMLAAVGGLAGFVAYHFATSVARRKSGPDGLRDELSVTRDKAYSTRTYAMTPRWRNVAYAMAAFGFVGGLLVSHDRIAGPIGAILNIFIWYGAVYLVFRVTRRLRSTGAPAGAAPAQADGSLADRLAQLDEARKTGLITNDEHLARRAKILDEV